MSNRSKSLTYDAALAMDDGVTSYVADGFGTVGGSAAQVLVGAETAGDWSVGADAELVVLVDVSESASTGDETYLVEIQGSVIGDFTDAEVIATIPVTTGADGLIRTERVIRLWKDVAGVEEQVYKKIRSAHTITGTSPGLTYRAYAGLSTLVA